MWSVGLMDKASASGAGDSRLESWADQQYTGSVCGSSSRDASPVLPARLWRGKCALARGYTGPASAPVWPLRGSDVGASAGRAAKLVAGFWVMCVAALAMGGLLA